VTCGDWDLAIGLKNEALYKEIPIPDYFKTWINLKKVFPRDFYERSTLPPEQEPQSAGSISFKPNTVSGMKEMLRILRLRLMGRLIANISFKNNN